MNILGMSCYPSIKVALLLLLVTGLQPIFISGASINALLANSSTALVGDPPEICEAVKCEAGFYQTLDNDGKLVKYDFDGFALGFTQISTFGFEVNATAYNVVDDFFYTISIGDRRLIRFSTDGTWTDQGALNLPNNMYVGSFDNAGNFYVTSGIFNSDVYRINVNTLQVETLTLSTNLSFRASDWAYIHCENKFYGVGSDNLLYCFDPVSLSVTRTALTGDFSEVSFNGGAFTDINSTLYISNNVSGNIYSIDVSTNASTLILNGPSTNTNDGASCPCALPPFPSLALQDDELCVSNEDEALEIFLNDSFSFANLDYSTFEVVEEPKNGTVSFTEQTQSVFYDSNDPTLADTFVYRICLDLAQEYCEEATVYILPTSTVLINESICTDEEFTIDEFTFTESGTYDISYDASNGCDSIVTLQLEVFENEDLILKEQICTSEEFNFDGMGYTESGFYEFNYSTTEGCDSTVLLDLTVNPIFSELIEQTICEGEEFVFDDQVYIDEGLYMLPYTTTLGCDSIYTIDLIVNKNGIATLDRNLCGGEVFELNGTTYSDSGEYTQELSTVNGCDSTLTLTLEIDEIIEENLTENICQGEELILSDGSVFSEEGDYELLFQAASGCDSTLNLRINVLLNPVFQVDAQICSIDFYALPDGTAYNESGTYELSYQATNGCDSTFLLNLVVNETIEENLELSICTGDSVTIGGNIYTESGEYTNQFVSASNCDSIVNLILTVGDDYMIDQEQVICAGESITIGGVTYTEEGIYTQDYFTSSGCDSIVTIDLKVNPEFEFAQEDAICEGEQVQIGQEVFTTGGIYEIMFTSVSGCDSLIVLELTEYQNELENRSQEICEGEEVAIGNDVYTTTGIHTSSFNTVQGCDSTIVLDLVVNLNYEFFDQAQICETESFDFAGQTFSESGIHEVRLQTSTGCDSILVLDLLVNDPAAVTFEETICFGSTYSFGGEVYSEEGEYTQNLSTVNGCDSTVTLNLNLADRFETNLVENICEGESIEVGNETFTETGIYEVLMLASNGCDSLVTLDLEKFSPSNETLEASICSGSIYTFGIDDLDAGGVYTLELTNINGCDSLVLLDLQELEVYEIDKDQEICEGDSYEIGNSSYASTGIYFDTFISSDGCDSTIVTNLVVRENTMSESEVFTCFEDQVGQEIVVLSNSFGCDSTVITNTFLSPPAECFVVVGVDGMTIPCVESFGILSVEIFVGTPPFTINWSGPSSGSLVQSTLGTFNLENLPPGNYSIEVIDANGNSAEEDSEILEFDIPNVVADIPLNFSGFNIDCFGGMNGSASVTAFGGEEPYIYNWSNGEIGEEIQNLNSGTYSVTLTDANNCIDVTEVEITEPDPLEFDIDPIDLACDDPQSGVVIIDPSGGIPPYTYSVNDMDSQSENTFLNLTAGDYTSLVEDANGCISEGEFTLFMPTPVEVELGEDISIDLGEIVQLQASLNLGTQEVNEVLWSDNLETNCPECLLQTFAPTESGTYTIYVLDENGCETTDQIVINVDTDQGIYIPNAFSPNGDGINDVFTLYSDSRFSPIISELHIYDRWGDEVFVRYDFPPNAEDFGWNGVFRGELHNPGVFVYHATVKFIDGTKAFFKGDVTLVN